MDMTDKSGDRFGGANNLISPEMNRNISVLMLLYMTYNQAVITAFGTMIHIQEYHPLAEKLFQSVVDIPEPADLRLSSAMNFVFALAETKPMLIELDTALRKEGVHIKTVGNMYITDAIMEMFSSI